MEDLTRPEFNHVSLDRSDPLAVALRSADLLDQAGHQSIEITARLTVRIRQLIKQLKRLVSERTAQAAVD